MLLVVLLAACATITPPTGPGTEWPCGVWGVQCPNGACCPYAHECGGNGRCPEGACCYVGERWP